MADLVLLALPRTARASLIGAFASVGVEVEVPDRPSRLRRAVRAGTPFGTVLRDPVERLQSFVNTRLRSARPHHPQVWSDREAAVFSVLRSVDALGESLMADDPWLRSVGDRALLVWLDDFGSLAGLTEIVQETGATIAGDMSDLPAAVARLAALVGCAVPELPTDPAVIDATPDSLRGPLSELAMAGFRSRLGDELAAYEALKVAAR